jgi:hypothetical protein
VPYIPYSPGPTSPEPELRWSLVFVMCMGSAHKGMPLECPDMSGSANEEYAHLYMRGVNEAASGMQLDAQDVLDVLDAFGGDGVRWYLTGVLEGSEDRVEQEIEEYEMLEDSIRAFYAEKLGLEPSEERPGGLLYRCGEGEFALFESAGAASGDHTQMGWEVEDIEATVEWLRVRRVVFEEYGLPGLRTVNGIAKVAGNYPSKGGVGEKAAWFRDSEGNLFGIGQPIDELKDG